MNRLRGSDDAVRPAGQPLMTEALHEDSVERAYDMRLLRRLAPFARPHATLLVGALLLMPLAAAGSLLQPFLLKKAVDATLVERSSEALLLVVWWFVGAIVLEFLGRFAQTYATQLAGQHIMADLRRHVFGHIQRLGVRYFDRTPVGRVVTRVTNDIDSLGELFASGAVTAVGDAIMLLGIVGFMLYLDWELTLVTFLALPPLVVAVRVFRRYARRAFREIRLRVAQLNAYLNEQVQGIAVVQAFGREDTCAAEYDRINMANREAHRRAIRYDALLYSVVEAISTASVAIVLWYASVRVGLVQDSPGSAAYVGTVVAFYEYIQRFFIPIRDLTGKFTILQQALASSERIFGLLDEDETDAPEGRAPARVPEVPEGVHVAFRGVTFGYRPEHPVVHDLSFDVPRGAKVAIVGATGAGKTTITALLLRLYELEQGAVLVDGQDVRAHDRHALRQKFAVVPQDVFLFAGTILQNVALGDPAPDAARAREALERVGAWDLVERRGGLGARVDARGDNFSAGERQLLAFARALYRDAEILILDEATASVDSETEARLQAAVLELLEGRTAIVIAHRLSTIRRSDRILVMHHGRLVEQGPHDDLLRRDGVYARLHRLQFEDTGEAADAGSPAPA
ncbi:MAG: ABC transporter ATP-binding protein [Myxococcota bacterium]